jgi:nitrite reductase/ring-hydroxylating ferredoxin subunit
VLDFIPGQERASRTLVGVGLLGVIPAASAGIADWSVLTQKQQRVGIVHWAANLTSVGLYTASYIQRRRGKQVSGKVLGLLGLAVVSASGYLGGHLAYRQGANVLPTDEPDFASATADAVADQWKPLGQLVIFQERRLTASELDGVKLVVYRDGVDVAVLAGTCSYCDDDLSAGNVEAHGEGDRLECPQDGSIFELATGAVVRGPATSPLPRFDVLIDEGVVNVRK